MLEQLQTALNDVFKNNEQTPQDGGASKIAKKREKLNSMKFEELAKKAKTFNLSVTKKKNGKTVNIKKASLVSKILKHMVNKKMI